MRLARGGQRLGASSQAPSVPRASGSGGVKEGLAGAFGQVTRCGPDASWTHWTPEMLRVIKMRLPCRRQERPGQSHLHEATYSPGFEAVRRRREGAYGGSSTRCPPLPGAIVSVHVGCERPERGSAGGRLSLTGPNEARFAFSSSLCDTRCNSSAPGTARTFVLYLSPRWCAASRRLRR